MTSRLRLLVIADVGGEGTRHIGDEAMLEANLAAFRRLIPDVAFTVVSADPAWVASRYGVDAVARADGIVISGGGCLSSSWPYLLYERVALLQLARRFGKPAVVLGQTLGPRLREDERNLLADALSSARFVGLRELPSIALAFGMGVPPARLWYQADDVMFLSASEDAGSDAAPALTIAVTIDPQLRAAGDRLFDAFARQL